MKNLRYYLLALLSLFTLGACDDYLDINNNPDSPDATVPPCSLRLRGILANFGSCYEFGGFRGMFYTQNLAKTAGSASSDYLIKWDPTNASSSYPNQGWFVYCANNIPYLIDKAEETGAYHYIGAGKVILAWGFMTMVDVYGEVPFTEALSSITNPKFDSGKDVYYGCMNLLDEALAEFEKTQEPTAELLSAGDIWNDGNVQTWIKLIHGLKARWMLKLSKKDIFDPEGILTELEQAPQSNAESTIMRYENSNDPNTSGNLYGSLFGNFTNTSSRLTKWYISLMDNTFTGGSGVEDPRIDLMVPSGEFCIDGKIQMRRAVGIDIASDIYLQGGPVTFDIYEHPDGKHNYWRAVGNTTDPNRWGDSIYVPIYSDCLSWILGMEGDLTDDRYVAYHYNGMKGLTDQEKAQTIQVISTGVFQMRADAPSYYLAYPEMCFIKAEVLYRLGRKDEALRAYKDGIRAHMELMNEKLATYDQSIFGKQVIPEEAISDFLNSAAVAQTAGELKMSHIMQQKFLACSFLLENWNDMRRFNYGATDPEFGVVYPDFKRPGNYDAESAMNFLGNDDPQNLRYWPRRLEQPSYESQYNTTHWLASNPEASELTIVSYPVWWDCTTAEEGIYFNYTIE